MALEVPYEVWQLISDYLMSDRLSQICQKLSPLGRRFVRFDFTSANAIQRLAAVSDTVRVLTASGTDMYQNGHWDHKDPALEALQYSPFLHRLHLKFRDSLLSQHDGVKALASLHSLPSLQTLILDLKSNEVGDRGAEAVSLLRYAQKLRTLTLCLSFQWLGERERISDRGARALASLKDSPALASLTLDLSDNQVTERGAQALAELKDAPDLRSLSLSIGNNPIRAGGARALAGLKESVSLHTLSLDFSFNQVGPLGMQALAALKEAAALRTLTLNLMYNSAGDGGAQALAELKESASLQTLTLNLQYNSVGQAGAEALAELKDAPALHSFVLNILHNPVGEAGARTLMSMRHAREWTCLQLVLGRPWGNVVVPAA